MTTEILYDVKTHQESFTDLEIELRRNLEAHLPEDLRNYTTEQDLENLKEYRATADTFHPENHFYVFNSDGDLLGFTHLWPNYSGEDNQEIGEIAGITLPFVKDKNPNVEKVLHNALIEKSKQLGVKTLRIEAAAHHEELLERLDAFGFKYSNLASLRSELSLLDLKLRNVAGYDIKEFDEERDGEALLDAYEVLGYPREQIKNQFQSMRDLGERVLSWKVAYDGEKLVGQGIAFLRQQDGKLASLNVVTQGKEVSDETYEEVVHAVYAAHLPALEKAGVDTLELFVLQSVLDLRPIYEELGFEFVQRDHYTFDI